VAKVVGMPSALRDLVNRRALRHVSAEVYPHWELTAGAEQSGTTNVQGMQLAALAYLGADIPRCRTLAELPRILASENDEPKTRPIEKRIAACEAKFECLRRARADMSQRLTR